MFSFMVIFFYFFIIETRTDLYTFTDSSFESSQIFTFSSSFCESFSFPNIFLIKSVLELSAKRKNLHMRDEILIDLNILLCGTPHLFFDGALPILATCSLLLRYRNQRNMVPLSPWFYSFLIRILCSMVAKASAKSRKTLQASSPLSRELTILV